MTPISQSYQSYPEICSGWPDKPLGSIKIIDSENYRDYFYKVYKIRVAKADLSY